MDLVVEPWDEVTECHQELPTNQATLDVVEQCFTDYERDPSTAMTLEEFTHKFLLP